MTPLIKSLLLYLLMIGLVASNALAVSISPLSIYIVYIIIIITVYYLNEGLFWGKKSSPGLLFGSVLIGTVFAVEIIAGWIKVEGFNFDTSMLFSFLTLQIIVAVGEEISFRGYILKNLVNDTGIRAGIFLSSLMFSTIHIPSIVYYGLDASRGIIAFTVVGLLGAIAAIIYLEYGLKSAIGFHFAWNFLQYNLFTLAGTQPGLMESRYLEPNLVTGGNYGPEAGMLGFIVVLFALVIFIKNSQKLR